MLLLGVVAAAARLALPSVLRWYVVRTIDRDPMYTGNIDDIDVHLWRGAYTIRGIRINKVTGSIPAPLFVADKMDLALQWSALIHGKLVGRVRFGEPEINFVDATDPSQVQTGAGGPWLEIIRDLFPFKINRAEIVDGTIRFRAPHKTPPVD